MVEGEKAVFTCTVSKETYEVKWLKGDKELEDGDKYQVVSDGKKRTLVIKNCDLQDEDEYVVIIGATKARADLKVLGKSLRNLPLNKSNHLNAESHLANRKPSRSNFDD